MEEAYYGLRNARTRYKHVLVLTDAGVETGPYESLLRRMARDRISVSTVLVGPGRHSEFLVQLADWGNGRYYNASDRFNLPEIMLKQPSTARLPAYRPGSHPLTPRGGPGWWGPIDPLSTPPLAGYVETRGRPGADVVLETVRDRHPILASWRFGLGRVTTLMTEPTGPGTEPWRGWPGFGPMLARVMERTASTTREPFDFRLRRDDHRLILRAERRERGTIQPTAHLLGEGAAAPRPLIFRERAEGIFTAEIILDPDVAAHIVAGTNDAGRGVRLRLASDARADVAPEQQVDPLRALDLGELSSATGGQSVTSDTGQGFVPRAAGGTRPYSVLKLWPWCLLAALLFFICEIAYRRSPIRRVTE